MADTKQVLFHKGKAMTLNVSSGGMLLLIPHAPKVNTVFEIHTPIPASKQETPRDELRLVEVRWSRNLLPDHITGTHTTMSFVGVQFIFNLPLAGRGKGTMRRDS